jgi:hypothetical protein
VNGLAATNRANQRGAYDALGSIYWYDVAYVDHFAYLNIAGGFCDLMPQRAFEDCAGFEHSSPCAARVRRVQALGNGPFGLRWISHMQSGAHYGAGSDDLSIGGV